MLRKGWDALGQTRKALYLQAYTHLGTPLVLVCALIKVETGWDMGQEAPNQKLAAVSTFILRLRLRAEVGTTSVAVRSVSVLIRRFPLPRPSL